MASALTLSVREAARRTGAPMREIDAALERGELRGKRMKWGWLVYPDGLEEWVGLRDGTPAPSVKLPAKVEARLRAAGR
jgi:hypothetical protein